MDTEVTIQEIMNKYMITSDGKTSTGFRKHIILNDGRNAYSGKLNWNSDDGYWMFWEGDAPPEADRPEFEYVLDCITEMSN